MADGTVRRVAMAGTLKMAIAVGLMAASAADHAVRAQVPAATVTPPALSALSMMEEIRGLSSERDQGRAVATLGNARARTRIQYRFEALGLRPLASSLLIPFTFTPKGSDGAVGEVTGVNVIARCPGTESTLPAMVLSAHYDHLGIRDGRMYPGADDNASGVAVLFALAEQCVAQPFRHDLVFAAFDAEEAGLQGARAFVASGLLPRERIAVNVNLDMVARGDKGEIYIAGTHHYPALKALLDPVAAAAPIKVLFGHDRPGSGHDDWTLQSDHGEFHKVGIPFVYFGVEDHPDYHQPTDTADKIKPDFLVKAAGVILDALRALDAGLK